MKTRISLRSVFCLTSRLFFIHVSVLNINKNENEITSHCHIMFHCPKNSYRLVRVLARTNISVDARRKYFYVSHADVPLVTSRAHTLYNLCVPNDDSEAIWQPASVQPKTQICCVRFYIVPNVKCSRLQKLRISLESAENLKAVSLFERLLLILLITIYLTVEDNWKPQEKTWEDYFCWFSYSGVTWWVNSALWYDTEKGNNLSSLTIKPFLNSEGSKW